MSEERHCDCCKQIWYVSNLVSGLCPNCLDFLATKNQISIEQDQKIKELERRLSNCIVKPKFNVTDTIFVIVDDSIEEYFVDEIILRNKGTLWAYYDIDKATEITEKNELFATKEEAKAKLEELKK